MDSEVVSQARLGLVRLTDEGCEGSMAAGLNACVGTRSARWTTNVTSNSNPACVRDALDAPVQQAPEVRDAGGLVGCKKTTHLWGGGEHWVMRRSKKTSELARGR